MDNCFYLHLAKPFMKGEEKKSQPFPPPDLCRLSHILSAWLPPEMRGHWANDQHNPARCLWESWRGFG